ncbi:hypothetical protein [Gelidibacter gilvus]|uniref:DUF695 domain-containing protein n=1 Tax=Gelidibacter gilvus TaxID=59602 RepID=A0A4Q0XKC5_9FLAO|nr:hypothetical protein [Gelidibacter gilvus]RXJ51077.1 hypothetical protein ESZ48_04155 [Gelidibacter gilvus]
MSTHNHFWNWFRDNYQHLENPKDFDKIGYLMLEAQEELSYYSSNLTFFIKYAKEENKKNKLKFVSSGDRSVVVMVNYLLSKAPELPKWKFSLKKRSKRKLSKIIEGTDPDYEFGDFKIKISDLMFAPSNYCSDTEMFDITIYLSEFWKHPQVLLYQAMAILLEDLLGADYAYSKIDQLTLEQMPKNIEGLIPAHDMELFFQTFTME